MTNNQTSADHHFTHIDELRLDVEWVRQPQLYYTYAKQVAAARRRLDEAKNELEVTRADLYRAIAANHEAYGLAKNTDTAVSSAVLSQEEFTKAQRVLTDARYDLDVLDAALQALEHKKRALEKLVDLLLANYYAKPRASEANREDVEEMTKRVVRGRGVSDG